MKQLKKDLKAVLKSLKTLTKKTEQMAKRLVKLEKAQASKKPRAKKPKARAKITKKNVAKKPAKATAIDTVFTIIKSSKKGVDPATLRKKTGFDKKKIWNNINMLKKKGKIKSVDRGVYVKVG
jgi:hypothetical protein